jgi:hypothetical protein
MWFAQKVKRHDLMARNNFVPAARLAELHRRDAALRFSTTTLRRLGKPTDLAEYFVWQKTREKINHRIV